jgi:hypothetical protein
VEVNCSEASSSVSVSQVSSRPTHKYKTRLRCLSCEKRCRLFWCSIGDKKYKNCNTDTCPLSSFTIHQKIKLFRKFIKKNFFLTWGIKSTRIATQTPALSSLSQFIKKLNFLENPF